MTDKMNDLDTESTKSARLVEALHAGTSASVELDTTAHNTTDIISYTNSSTYVTQPLF